MSLRSIAARSLFAALFAVVAFATGSASAATVELVVREHDRDVGDFFGLRFVGAPGEINDVRVDFPNTSEQEVPTIVVEDAGASLRVVDEHCSAEGEHRVVCRDSRLVGGAFLRLGDGNDRLTTSAAAEQPSPSVFQGVSVLAGSGDDTLTGGELVDHYFYGRGGDDSLTAAGDGDSLHGDAGADTLTGGPGLDTLTGGPGTDEMNGGSPPSFDVFRDGETDRAAADDRIVAPGGGSLSYGKRDESVTIDLAAGVAGREGEHDTFENINEATGGRGDDLIVGTDGLDRLFGSAGADEVRGGDGNDEIGGGVGEDRLLGGEGGDSLQPGEDDAYDTTDCDLGDDFVYQQDSRDRLGDCETTGWGDEFSEPDLGQAPPGTHTIAVTPRVAEHHVTFKLTTTRSCCLPRRGRIRLVHPVTRRVLGEARFRLPKSATTPVEIPLTKRGGHRVQQRRYITTVITTTRSRSGFTTRFEP